MKRAIALLIPAALLLSACAQTETRVVTKEYQPGLHPIYVAPGPVAIDGGVRPSSLYIHPDDPFVTDYVLRRPVGSEYDQSTAIAVGMRIPDEVRLLDVPSTGYAYTVLNGKTVLVDPQRRRIVKVYPAG